MLLTVIKAANASSGTNMNDVALEVIEVVEEAKSAPGEEGRGIAFTNSHYGSIVPGTPAYRV